MARSGCTLVHVRADTRHEHGPIVLTPAEAPQRSRQTIILPTDEPTRPTDKPHQTNTRTHARTPTSKLLNRCQQTHASRQLTSYPWGVSLARAACVILPRAAGFRCAHCWTAAGELFASRRLAAFSPPSPVTLCASLGYTALWRAMRRRRSADQCDGIARAVRVSSLVRRCSFQARSRKKTHAGRNERQNHRV